MAYEDNEDQIIPEQFNMMLLKFLVANGEEYWNVSEISRKAAPKSLNNTRVKKSITYFKKKKFVSEFSDLDLDKRKKHKKERVKEIVSDSYRITDPGKRVYENITGACLDPVGQRLLSFKKIE